MIECIDKDDATPLCPHCNDSLTQIWRRLVRTVLGKSHIYFCPKCRKTIGISNRKGFWMG